MAALYLAARYTGRRELFLLFFIMMIVLVCALALNLWTIFSFSYVQELTQSAAIKGGTARLKLGIYNDKPFPFTRMRVRVDPVVRSEQFLLDFNLSPKSHIRFDIPLHCAYRGLHEVGMTTLEAGDIFGLLRIPFDMRRLAYYRMRTQKVFPRLVTLPYLSAQTFDAKFSGGGLQRLSEEGETYADLRRYRPGDPLKRVHKSVSARRRELYVKSYDVPMETAVIVAIDTAADLGQGENALYLADLACECAAALVGYSLRMGYMVDMLEANPARPIHQGKGQPDFPRLYVALAVMPFEREGDLPLRLDVESRRSPDLRAVYVLTTGAADRYGGVLSRLAKEGISVKLLLLSADSEDRAAHPAIPGVACVRLHVGDELSGVLL
jgi:uncharacterized protein (DUF58 family)